MKKDTTKCKVDQRIIEREKELVPSSFAIIISIILCMAIMLICLVANAETQLEIRSQRTSFTIYEIADAIYWAENSKKYPYGIKSVSCDTVAECRRICLNTIRNNIKRYNDYGYKEYDSYLEFLSSRYAPIGASNDPNNLNRNWIKNVLFYLQNPKEVI